MRAPSVRIATTHTQARHVLPPVLRQFRELHPRVTVQLRLGDSGQISELIARGVADVAIASGADPESLGLLRVPCFRWHRVIITPKDHPLAHVSQPTLAQLAEWPLVTYSLSSTHRSSLLEAFHREGLEPQIALTSWDSGVLKACIREGLGVGILADLAIDGREDADLRVRNATHLFEALTTWIGFPRLIDPPEGLFDLAALLAPQFGPSAARRLARVTSQHEIDQLTALSGIPFRR